MKTTHATDTGIYNPSGNFVSIKEYLKFLICNSIYLIPMLEQFV